MCGALLHRVSFGFRPIQSSRKSSILWICVCALVIEYWSIHYGTCCGHHRCRRRRRSHRHCRHRHRHRHRRRWFLCIFSTIFPSMCVAQYDCTLHIRLLLNIRIPYKYLQPAAAHEDQKVLNIWVCRVVRIKIHIAHFMWKMWKSELDRKCESMLDRHARTHARMHACTARIQRVVGSEREKYSNNNDTTIIRYGRYDRVVPAITKYSLPEQSAYKRDWLSACENVCACECLQSVRSDELKRANLTDRNGKVELAGPSCCIRTN